MKVIVCKLCGAEIAFVGYWGERFPTKMYSCQSPGCEGSMRLSDDYIEAMLEGRLKDSNYEVKKVL